MGSADDQCEIRNLVARYAHAVGERDEAAWSSTWAADAEWHILGQTHTGREAIVGFWKRAVAGFPFILQQASSGLVEVDGDRARGRWSVTEWANDADGSGRATFGTYHDEYRRLDQGWRFQVRRFEMIYSGPTDLKGAAK